MIPLAVIVLSAIYLLWLAMISFMAPVLAARFLDSFASSARAHYLEQSIRIVVGAALLLHAPKMLYPDIFRIAGWVLVITTIPLLAIPWRWHQWIAHRAVPYATGNLKLFGLGSAVVGGFLLMSALHGVGF